MHQFTLFKIVVPVGAPSLGLVMNMLVFPFPNQAAVISTCLSAGFPRVSRK